jgi:hypothetical protein
LETERGGKPTCWAGTESKGREERRRVMPRGGPAPPWRQKAEKSAKSDEASSSSVPPWRQMKKPQEITHNNLKMKATNDPGGKGKMMYAPPSGTGLTQKPDGDSMFELDPQLKMSFARNFQV